MLNQSQKNILIQNDEQSSKDENYASIFNQFSNKSHLAFVSLLKGDQLFRNTLPHLSVCFWKFEQEEKE